MVKVLKKAKIIALHLKTFSKNFSAKSLIYRLPPLAPCVIYITQAHAKSGTLTSPASYVVFHGIIITHKKQGLKVLFFTAALGGSRECSVAEDRIGRYSFVANVIYGLFALYENSLGDFLRRKLVYVKEP